MQMRDFFINEIYNAAKKNKNIILITNDQGAQSLDKFRKDLPKQFINAGISEQNIITAAAGMAQQKKKIFVYSIASFITLRCLEQIKLDVNLMKLPVTIFGVGASYSYDNSGPTHHSIEDISILRTMKNLEIFSPSENNILKEIFNYVLKSKLPNYIRLDRQEQKSINRNNLNFKDGFHFVNKKFVDTIIVSTGNMTSTAIDISKKIKNLKNQDIGVIDIFKINFNLKKILLNNKKLKNIITIEEHLLEGGLGSIFAEYLFDYSLNKKISLKRFGINISNAYSYASREKIHDLNGITVSKIIKKI
jgi:transketolase